MQLHELQSLIQTMPWFSNLGHAFARDNVCALTDVELWRRYLQACTRAEFGLPHDSELLVQHPFGQMAWLPSSLDEPDPIHGDALAHQAHSLGRETELLAAKSKAFKAALVSQRSVPAHPLLQVGGIDLNEAARMAGKYACRMAAAEISLNCIGFWCDMFLLYHQGNWPMARMPDGTVVVL